MGGAGTFMIFFAKAFLQLSLGTPPMDVRSPCPSGFSLSVSRMLQAHRPAPPGLDHESQRAVGPVISGVELRRQRSRNSPKNSTCYRDPTGQDRPLFEAGERPLQTETAQRPGVSHVPVDRPSSLHRPPRATQVLGLRVTPKFHSEEVPKHGAPNSQTSKLPSEHRTSRIHRGGDPGSSAT